MTASSGKHQPATPATRQQTQDLCDRAIRGAAGRLMGTLRFSRIETASARAELVQQLGMAVGDVGVALFYARLLKRRRPARR